MDYHYSRLIFSESVLSLLKVDPRHAANKMEPGTQADAADPNECKVGGIAGPTQEL